MQPLRDNARVLTASLVGTAVEYYDFFIYGTAAALVFGPMFFPAESAAAQTLFALMSFGIAFVARPVGAVFFGHFGDRIGRKSTLVASLLLMGGSTLLIAFLPGYAMIGWTAPLLLCLLRFGQGLGLGGEWAGAALMAVENAPPGWATRFGAAPQVGVPIGLTAANGVFLLLSLMLSESDFAEWGWRIPFLISAVLVILGLWIRLRIEETPAFRAALELAPPPRVPIVRLLREHSGAMIAGSAGVVVCFALFYVATVFALAQATGELGYDRNAFLSIQLVSNVVFAIAILIAATLADRTSPALTLRIGAVAAAVVGVFFGPGLMSGSLVVAAVTLSAAMFVMGFTNAALGHWLSTLFPVPVRYTGVAFAFNFGGMIGGAMTPVLAQILSTAWGPASSGLLLVVAGMVTLAGVMLGRPASQE